jgi:hypothetical protein
MPLEQFYKDDETFVNYSLCFQKEWEAFEFKEELLELVRGDVDLARPLAYHLKSSFSEWFTSSVPALDNLSPSECMKTSQGIKRLKVCLMRFP